MERLVRDSMFRGKQDFRLDPQADREHFHLPNAIFGAVGRLRDTVSTPTHRLIPVR